MHSVEESMENLNDIDVDAEENELCDLVEKAKEEIYLGCKSFTTLSHVTRWGWTKNNESRSAPLPLSSEQELQQVDEAESRNFEDNPWKGRSIFFELPYLEHNILRHNLDVMHIEKNVLDNILNTLLGLKGGKDNYNARMDLKILGIMH